MKKLLLILTIATVSCTKNKPYHGYVCDCARTFYGKITPLRSYYGDVPEPLAFALCDSSKMDLVLKYGYSNGGSNGVVCDLEYK